MADQLFLDPQRLCSSSVMISRQAWALPGKGDSGFAKNIFICRCTRWHFNFAATLKEMRTIKRDGTCGAIGRGCAVIAERWRSHHSKTFTLGAFNNPNPASGCAAFCRMTTFRSYLATRRAMENSAGDFARQIKDDPAMDSIEEWPQLRAYVYRKAHPDKVKDTLDAAEPVWKGYRAYVLKHRRQD